jgi:hypothetical protein
LLACGGRDLCELVFGAAIADVTRQELGRPASKPQIFRPFSLSSEKRFDVWVPPRRSVPAFLMLAQGFDAMVAGVSHRALRDQRVKSYHVDGRLCEKSGALAWSVQPGRL